MAARTGPRRCAHCRKELLDREERRPDREYCDSGCRARASEARKKAASGHAAKKRPRSAQKRSRAAQTRRKPELRISYRKAVAATAGYPGAEADLRALLTDR